MRILIGFVVAMICWAAVVLLRVPLEALLDYLRDKLTGRKGR